MDVVYPVAHEPLSEELRYALRSLANMPHGTVWLVGHAPVWAQDVRHVPVPPVGPTKWQRANDNLRAVLAQPDLSDEFVFMNDDFYVLEPMVSPPLWHEGVIDKVAAGWKSVHRRRGLTATATLLRQMGIPGPLYSYELHIPMVVNRHRMLELLEVGLRSGIVPLMTRTLYGNAMRLGGERHADVKVYRGTRDVDFTSWPLLSTDERSFIFGPAGAEVRRRFPTRSPYEAAGARGAIPSRHQLVNRRRMLRVEETVISDVVLIAKRSATVRIDGRRKTVRRGQTTAHRDAPIVASHPHLWEPLRLDYPAPFMPDVFDPDPATAPAEPTPETPPAPDQPDTAPDEAGPDEAGADADPADVDEDQDDELAPAAAAPAPRKRASKAVKSDATAGA